MIGPTRRHITHYIAQSKNNDGVISGYRLDYNIYEIRPQHNSLMKLIFPSENSCVGRIKRPIGRFSPNNVGGVLPHMK